MAIITTLHSTFLLSHSPLTLLHKPSKLPSKLKLTTTIKSQINGTDSPDPGDRIISAVTYFYPFFDGIQYGKHVITQFSPIGALIQPLVPSIRAFKSFPFNGVLVFVTLYFLVVRNPSFNKYVRFNTMQAIVLDVLLIFPDLLESSFGGGGGGDGLGTMGGYVVMSLESTVFVFMLVCLVYGSLSCLFGRLPRLPIVAEAAERQVF